MISILNSEITTNDVIANGVDERGKKYIYIYICNGNSNGKEKKKKKK